jgi:biopolymer transport protein TolR
MGASLGKPAGSGRMRRRVGSFAPMAEINVTPFVDVMLVLLIVFMVTAPLITQGVSVNLPEVDTAMINEPTEPLTIVIKRDGKIFFGETEVVESQLDSRLKAIHQRKSDQEILVKADTKVPYGAVMTVMGALQNNGLSNVGLVTQPKG